MKQPNEIEHGAGSGCSTPPCVCFTVLDLFSGIGGFALATEWAGGRTIAFAEVADYQSKILSSRWPNVPNLGDVTKLCRRIYDCEIDSDDDELIWCPRCSTEENRIDFGECECIGTDQFTDTYGFPDVVAGGVPCQPASLVGKRRGSADARWMWPDTLRIIRELEPRYAIMENPRAILTLEGGRAFRRILADFAEIGYDVQWDVVSASALGAGHRRERLWILATNADCQGLERHAGHEEEIRIACSHGYTAPQDLLARKFTSEKWYHQSGISPVVDGIPGGLAKDQLTSVGNSLVPHCALTWLRGIATQFYCENNMI